MAKINFYDASNPMLEYEVGGFKYSFSVAKFPVETYDWLCECIQTDVNKIYKLAYADGRYEVQYGIKKLLGLR